MLKQNQIVNLPNYVKSVNHNFLCQFSESIVFDNIINVALPEKFKESITGKEFMITIAKNYTKFNDKWESEYNEIIIKVLVEYKSEMYVYPVLTLVDDELSLIRGYLLGFEKYWLCNLALKPQNIFYSDDRLTIDFKIDSKIDKSISPNYDYPFILVDRDSNKLKKLEVSDYKCLKEYVPFSTKATGGGTIYDKKYNVTRYSRTASEFTIEGLSDIYGDPE